MSYETCENCGKSGETDNDEGGLWYRVCYTCAACVKAQIAAEDPSGDDWEERQIREHWADRHPADKEPIAQESFNADNQQEGEK